MKTCNRCRVQKELDAFPHCYDKRGYTYYRGICKVCVNRRNRVARADKDDRDIAIDTVSRRPCDTCYRIDLCKTEAFECAAFEQWVTEGQFTPAFVGMRERVAAPVLIPSTSLRGTGAEA